MQITNLPTAERNHSKQTALLVMLSTLVWILCETYKAAEWSLMRIFKSYYITVVEIVEEDSSESQSTNLIIMVTCDVKKGVHKANRGKSCKWNSYIQYSLMVLLIFINNWWSFQKHESTLIQISQLNFVNIFDKIRWKVNLSWLLLWKRLNWCNMKRQSDLCPLCWSYTVLCSWSVLIQRSNRGSTHEWGILKWPHWWKKEMTLNLFWLFLLNTSFSVLSHSVLFDKVVGISGRTNCNK